MYTWHLLCEVEAMAADLSWESAELMFGISLRRELRRRAVLYIEFEGERRATGTWHELAEGPKASIGTGRFRSALI